MWFHGFNSPDDLGADDGEDLGSLSVLDTVFGVEGDEEFEGIEVDGLELDGLEGLELGSEDPGDDTGFDETDLSGEDDFGDEIEGWEDTVGGIVATGSQLWGQYQSIRNAPSSAVASGGAGVTPGVAPARRRRKSARRSARQSALASGGSGAAPSGRGSGKLPVWLLAGGAVVVGYMMLRSR